MRIDELFDQVMEEDKFFTKLVDMIPANMYFDQDVQEKITVAKHLAMDKTAEDLKRKFSNHPELSAKNKHKRARLDPLCQKSVSQIHQEMDQTKQKKHKKLKDMLSPCASLTRAENIEELQKRLQERIDQLQAKRKGLAQSNPSMKYLKKKEKKLKMKQRGSLKKPVHSATGGKTHLIKKKEENVSKPIVNKENKIIYSKFDFSEDGTEETKKGEFSGKNYKLLLKKAEKKKEKMENIKNTDPGKAAVIAEKYKWTKAIQKSEGMKIKDDPTLLKKSLKRQEKRKKKSAKIWKERIEHTDSKKKARQDKRAKNIKMKKNEKKEHKIKRARKKGRMVPGF